VTTALALIAALAAPPTLGDGLRAIGAVPGCVRTEAQIPDSSALFGLASAACLSEDPLATRLVPGPPPPRTAARVLLGLSGAVALAGLVGTVVSPGCATRDAEQRCVDAQGTAAIFPALLVLGLGGLTTAAFWYRQDLPEAP